MLNNGKKPDLSVVILVLRNVWTLHFFIKITILFLSFFFLKCSDEADNDKYNDNIIRFGIMSMIASHENTVITDNNNGTLDYTITDFYGNVKWKIRFKKCLQGQVYRFAENDCRGAGTATNGWNASLLNYCNTNTFACNPVVDGSQTYLVSGAQSQIFFSCDADATAGLKWRVVNIYEYKADNIAKIYRNYNKDLPSDLGSTGIWYAESEKSPEFAFFYKENYVDRVNFKEALDYKTALKYTLCVEKL